MSASESTIDEEEERDNKNERSGSKANASNTSLTAHNSINKSKSKEDPSASSTGASDSEGDNDSKEESLHLSSAKDASYRSLHSSPEYIRRRARAAHDRSTSGSPAKGAMGDGVDIPEKQDSSTITSLIWIFVVLAVIIGLVSYLKPNQDEQPASPPPQPSVVFGRKLGELKMQTDQDEKLWRIILSTMKTHIEDDEPRQPNVLMLVSSPDAAKTRERVAKDVAAAYSARCSNESAVQILGRDYTDVQHFDAKEKVDEAITGGLEEGACAVVVSNFEALPPASTTVFYQFCENDFAPFKAVSVIFTLEVSHGSWDAENQYTSLHDGDVPKSKFWDAIVDAFLYQSLGTRDGSGTMKRDMIAGLLTRITPSVAWVKADENFN